MEDQKIEVASITRIRLLQQACYGESFSAVLLIGGVDGRYTYGATATLSWLFLGKSGQSLSRQTMGNIEGSTADWGPTEAHEAMDETFILVTRDRVVVFMDPAAAPVLQPILSFWSSSNVGLVVISGGEDQKVFEFKSAVLEYLSEGEVVALPIPLGAEEASFEVERWPLIASYAVELEDCTIGQTGFFTMRHPIVDLCPLMESSLFNQVDALVVSQCAEDTLGSFRQHWQLTAKHMSQSKRELLTEENCVDHLSILFDSSIAYPMEAHHLPRALVGHKRSELIADNQTKPLSQPSSPDDVHIIVESSDARSGATVCRTFFLSTGRMDDECAVSSPCEQLMRSYLALQSTYSNSLASTSFELKDTQSFVPTLEKMMHGMVDDTSLDGKLELQVELFDAHGKLLKSQDDLSVAFCYVRASLHGIKFQGNSIGAVAVGDTFVVSKSFATVTLTCLTDGRCAPYCVAVTGLGEYEATLLRELSTSLRNHQPVGGVSLGLLKENIAGEVLMALSTSSCSRWTHIAGQLKLFERGFALTQTGFAPLMVSFRHHLRGAKIVDHPAGSMLLLAFLNSDGAGEKGGATLKPEHVLPLVRGLEFAALVLPSTSRHLSSVMHALTDWRLFAMQEDVPLTQDFQVPQHVLHFAETSCVDCFPTFKQSLFKQCVNADAVSMLKVVQTSSSAADLDKRNSVGISVVMGLHGSGVLDVYASLSNFCPDDILLKPLLDFPTSVQDIQDDLQQLLQQSSGAPRERLLLALVSSMNVIQVTAVIEATAGVHVSSVTTCVNAGTLKERMSGSIYHRFRHGVLDLAADGWTSTMIALDASSSKTNELNTEELRHAVRNINSGCLLSRTNRGYLSSESVNTILNKPSFQHPNMQAKRESHLCIGWQNMKFASAKVAKAFTMQFPEKSEVSALRLQIILSKIFPSATVRFPAHSLDQIQPSPQDQSFGVRRLWQIAQARKCGEQGHAARVALIEQLSRDMQGSLNSASIHGEVLLGDKSIAIEGSSSSLSVVSLKRSEGGVKGSYLTFASGDRLTDAVCEQLKQLLLLAVGDLPPHLPTRTRDSLSKQEVSFLMSGRLSKTPLPEGWLYDGNNYVNFDGSRMAERPDKEEILRNWLLEENAKLAFWSTSR